MKLHYALSFVAIFGIVAISSPTVAQEIQSPSTEQYNRGITLFEKGLYAQSAQELQAFIEAHANHSLIESAQFYAVRARARQLPSQAGSLYDGFIQDHPNTVFAQKLLLNVAEIEKESGNNDAALENYKRVLQQSANNNQSAKIYYWMAEVEAEQGNYNQARSYFLTLAQDYPKSPLAPKALYARGRLYLTEGEYEAASQAFELLEDSYPNDPMTRRIGTALGEAYYRQQQYQKAITALKNSLPYLEDDQRAKAIYLIAESHNAMNAFDQASSNYLQYINLTKGTDKERTAHYGLGWVYHKQEIYHWAADEFAKAATGTDTLARKALYYEAVNEKLGGRYENALETFRTFGKQYTSGLWFEQGYYEWAITAYEMGHYGEAIETLLVPVRSGQQLSMEGEIYTLLGQSYFANKEYTRALQAFEAAEDLTNINPDVKRQARFQKAWVQYRNQAYRPAQQTFEALYNEEPSSERGQQALFWSADSYYNLVQYSSAAAQFRQFIQNNPDDKLSGAARYSLGWSYFKMGEYEQSIAPFQQFLANYNPPDIALFPYDTDTRLRLGDAYYAMGNYQQAIDTYQRSVNASPGGDYALFQIGNSYYRSERTYEAVTTFRRFLRTYSNSNLTEQAQYNIAYIYLNTGNYRQAVQEFETAINNYPGTSWAARSQYNIGDAYYNAGEYQQAIAAYQKVLSDYANSDYVIEAANGIDYARQAAQGNAPAAAADTAGSAMDDFIRNNAQSGTADKLRYQQAESLVQSGDYINAITKLEQYIRISNNNELLPSAYLYVGQSYEQTSRTADARQRYQTLVETYPNTDEAAQALLALGRLASAEGNSSQAFSYYQQLADKGESYRAQALVGMGDAQQAMGNTTAAQQHYAQALEAAPNSSAAVIGQASVAIQNGNYEQARAALQPVADGPASENAAHAQYLLAFNLQQQGQLERAIEGYNNVQVLFEAYEEWVAKAMLKTGDAYQELNQPEQARRSYSDLIKRYPQRPEAAQARQRLSAN